MYICRACHVTMPWMSYMPCMHACTCVHQNRKSYLNVLKQCIELVKYLNERMAKWLLKYGQSPY